MQNTEISYKKNNTVEFRNEKKIISNQSANYLINFSNFKIQRNIRSKTN